MRHLIALLFLFPMYVQADTYFFAQYGESKLDLRHEYIVDAQLDSTFDRVGVGVRRNSWLAWEVSLADLGSYRFQLEKPVTILEYGKYKWGIDVPGFAELRMRSVALHARVGPEWGFFGKAGVDYLMAEASLHTPIGYRLYNREQFLPSFEVGYQYKKARFSYTYIPYLSGWSIGGQFDF